MRDAISAVEAKELLVEEDAANTQTLSLMNGGIPDLLAVDRLEVDRSASAAERDINGALNPHTLSIENKKNSRIIIDRLILENFKSYSGVKVIGPFYKKFSCIVGPNGSGKSNIIDAMLFVFGRRAKKIRQNKLCDLIHSSKYSMHNEYTKVSIQFRTISEGGEQCNDPSQQEGRAKWEGSEQWDGQEQWDRPAEWQPPPLESPQHFTISREATADNQSRYRINDKVVTQKEVFDLLLQKGIDLRNNRFLILQGEVEQISQMSPKGNKNEEGLLEYLEDIIGTNSYIEGINNSLEELERSEEVYHDKVNRLKHVYNELKELAGPKKEAKYYVQLQKFTYKLNILIVKKDKFELAKRISIKEEELAKYVKEKEQHNVVYATLLKERKEMNIILSSLENEESEIIRRKNKVDNEFKVLTTQDENVKKELLIVVEKIQNLYVKREQLREKDIPLYKSIIESKQKILNVLKRENIPKLERQLEKCEEEMEKYNEEIKTDTDRINTIYSNEEKKLAPLQNSYDDLVRVTSEYSNRSNLIEKKQREFLAHQENLKYLQTKLLNEMKEIDVQLKHMSKVESEKRKALHAKEELVTRIDNETEQVTNKLVNLTVKYETMKKELNTDRSLSKLHELIYHLKKTKIKGIHGVLGDLGSIDPKHEKAFLIAGNNCTDFVVVDKPHDAVLLFEQMRKHNLGRVNVLSLSILEANLLPVMKKHDENYTPLLPNVHRLIDFIRFKDEKYRVCFYYAVKETLVANTLEEAHVIGYSHKRRVVTVGGELIENDGRICGGGLLNKQGKGAGWGGRTSVRKSCGNAGTEEQGSHCSSSFFRAEAPSQYDQNDVAKTEGDIKEANKTMEDLKLRKGNLLSEIKEITTLIEDNECKLEIAKKRIENCKKQLKDIDGQLQNSDVPELTPEEKKELEHIKEMIEQKNDERNKVEILLKAQESKVKMYYEQLQNVGGEKKKTLKNKFMYAERQLNITRDEIAKHSSEEVNALANLQKGEKDILKFTDEIEEYEKNEKELESELKDLETKGCMVYEEIEKMEKEVAKVQAQMEENQKKKQQIDENISKKDLENVDLVYKTENLQKEIEQLRLRGIAYEGKIDEYTRLIEQADRVVVENKPCRASGGASADQSTDEESSQESGEESGEEGSKEDLEDGLDDHDDGAVGGKRKRSSEGAAQSRKRKRGSAEESGDGSGDGSGDTRGGDRESDAEGGDPRQRDEDQEEELKALEDMACDNEEWSDLESEYDYANVTDEQLQCMNRKEVENKLESKLRLLQKKAPNLKVFQDYNVKLYDYIKRRKDVYKSRKKKDKLKKHYDNLCNKRRKEFLLAFNIIAAKLKEMYQMIAIGGDAELEIIDSSEIFNEGILFSVRPPKKSWKHIQNLSGGEKTLSSLALVFALHYFKPNPIYFMDEIDAALDFKNVSIISHYIKTKTSDAQFIVISLRNQMFELCDRMIGIYKTNDITKCITLNPRRFQGDQPEEEAQELGEEEVSTEEEAEKVNQLEDQANPYVTVPM
ncbi:structural maintenance-chromosome 4 [Plasmodium inui San Antonio 1]|uniref:Structural maintenance of chromosomes protein n=1 Tax=Plasmodium inui San Antonio 1 TaxID=1237626 RepID=W7A967_9APIC|nr:structural maintenance-chromosome 4 [Plasmodium inui San Antonio 1]EUD68215.1 structural maintenance-chromosome 4 [Plasmodium inui San Antonio 1]